MNRLYVLSVAAAALPCIAPAAEKLSDIQANIKSNSVDRSTRCAYYKAWFVDQCPKTELDAILGRNVSAYRRWIELEPKNPTPQSELGCVYAAAGKWKEARPELERAIAFGDKMERLRRAQCRWEMANCLWREGDKDGAKKLVAEVAALDWPNWTPDFANKARYLHLVWEDPDSVLDYYRLPFSEDGKPFPTPQRATYGETKVNLAKVEIVTGSSFAKAREDKREDPIVRLLKRKLTRFGSEFAPGGTKISIEISPNAPVDKPQGYELKVQGLGGLEGLGGLGGSGGLVSIKARDRLGATYGVVSFLQCIDRGETSKPSKPLNSELSKLSKPLNSDLSKPSIRTMRIEDWPKLEKRGTIAYWDCGHLDFALFNKISSIDFHIDGQYVLSPLDKEFYRLFAGSFRDFGIETYCIARDKTMRPLLALSEPRTRALHLAWAKFVASIGMGFSFHFDDERFPMRPADVKSAGTAANLDAKYLTGIYREVKKIYPDFKMLFCPPFYWGPTSPSKYPEPREPYLKSLGADLDPEIDVYWTGDSVGSWNFAPKTMKWFADLIGRKQTVFHNGDAANAHYSVQYGADPSGYKKSHCPETFAMISRFHQNTSRMQEATEVGSAMDWCWNPDAHDAETAVRRAADQLEGPGVSGILKAATPALAYFDKYRYGTPRGELFAENADELDVRVATASAAWSNAVAIAKNGGFFVADFNRCGLKWARRLAEYRRNPPDWLKEQVASAMESREFAVREAKFRDEDGDVFIPAATMFGATYVTGVSAWGDNFKRNVKYVSPGEELVGEFECIPFPPSKAYTLIVSARSFLEEKPTIEFVLNGKSVWRGEAFIAYYFTRIAVPLPVDALSRNNKLIIRNVSEGEPRDKKAMVHYAVVKRDEWVLVDGKARPATEK